MKKLIDIPDNIYPEVAKLAAIDKTNPKNWIESLIKKETGRRNGITICPDWFHEEMIKNNDDVFCSICGKQLQ